MNRALDEIQYRSRSAPLEKRLTFNDLQARNVGFQSPIPVDPTLEQMNSLAFKSMEGAMFESANMASGQIRAEKQTEVMIDEAAARNEIPRTAAAAMVAEMIIKSCNLWHFHMVLSKSTIEKVQNHYAGATFL